MAAPPARLPAFHLGLAAVRPPAAPQPGAVSAALTLALPAPGPKTYLTLRLDPAAGALTTAANGGALHYFRAADASLRPLPLAPSSLSLTAGDAYIAVAPAAAQVAGSAVLARFLHQRDYFNAQRLAEALLAHLRRLAGDAGLADGALVLVIEAR
jgi:hypothetical protein